MKRKIFTTALTAGIIVSMLGAVPAMAAKKTTVVVPTSIIGSNWDSDKKAWVKYSSATRVFNKKGLLTSFKEEYRDEDDEGYISNVRDLFRYNYTKKGYFNGTDRYTNGKKAPGDGTYTYSWSTNGRKETVYFTWKEWDTDENDDDVLVTRREKTLITYNKAGQKTSEKKYDTDGKLKNDHTYKYDKKGRIIRETDILYDEDEGKPVKYVYRYDFKYNKKGKLTSRSDYWNGKLQYTEKNTYKKGKLRKKVCTDIERELISAGKEAVKKEVSTISYKYKGKKITATRKLGGKKLSVTVYDTRFKFYEPVPQLRPLEIPYEVVSFTGYDSETGKVTRTEKYDLKRYKKGVRKGLVNSSILTANDYDPETGKLEETYKTKKTCTYKSVKMTKYNKFIQDYRNAYSRNGSFH